MCTGGGYLGKYHLFLRLFVKQYNGKVNSITPRTQRK